MEDIIIKIINYLIPVVLGYCISLIGSYKKKNKATNNALKIMLQNNLTNTYFVYNAKKKIPDYVYKNWLNMLKEYENLDGDDFIHVLDENIKKSWEIVRTDILNQEEAL